MKNLPKVQLRRKKKKFCFPIIIMLSPSGVEGKLHLDHNKLQASIHTSCLSKCLLINKYYHGDSSLEYCNILQRKEETEGDSLVV